MGARARVLIAPATASAAAAPWATGALLATAGLASSRWPVGDARDHDDALSSFEYCQSALSSVRRLTPARRASSRHVPRYSSQKLTG